MNFFDHKDLGNHLLQLCPKVVKHPVYRNDPVYRGQLLSKKQYIRCFRIKLLIASDGKCNCGESGEMLCYVGTWLRHPECQKPITLRYTQGSIRPLNRKPLTWRIWWALNNASKGQMGFNSAFKGLNAELNPICHLVALLRTHPILHVSRI